MAFFSMALKTQHTFPPNDELNPIVLKLTICKKTLSVSQCQATPTILLCSFVLLPELALALPERGKGQAALQITYPKLRKKPLANVVTCTQTPRLRWTSPGSSQGPSPTSVSSGQQQLSGCPGSRRTCPFQRRGRPQETNKVGKKGGITSRGVRSR